MFPRSEPALRALRRDVVYQPGGGERGVGDLFWPAGEVRGNPVLLIHGGGWNALAKESFEWMAPLFLREGRPVFNINYRLLDDAPWPACGDDCLAAARFVLQGGLPELGAPVRLLICGGSAGAHLAMMTALQLPPETVEAVLSLAGPSRLDWMAENRDPLGLHEGLLKRFFGRPVSPNGPEVAEASPARRIRKSAPPLFCLHSRNDQLVPLRHAEEAVRAWQAVGSAASLTIFDGDGALHGFWVGDDRERGVLRAEVSGFVSRVLAG